MEQLKIIYTLETYHATRGEVLVQQKLEVVVVRADME